MCILHNPTTPYAVINVPGTLSDQRQRSTLKKQSVVGTPVYPRNGGECWSVHVEVGYKSAWQVYTQSSGLAAVPEIETDAAATPKTYEISGFKR